MLMNKLYPHLSTIHDPAHAVYNLANSVNAEAVHLYGTSFESQLFTLKIRDAKGWLTTHIGYARRYGQGCLVHLYESDAPKSM